MLVSHSPGLPRAPDPRPEPHPLPQTPDHCLLRGWPCTPAPTSPPGPPSQGDPRPRTPGKRLLSYLEPRTAPPAFASTAQDLTGSHAALPWTDSPATERTQQLAVTPPPEPRSPGLTSSHVASKGGHGLCLDLFQKTSPTATGEPGLHCLRHLRARPLPGRVAQSSCLGNRSNMASWEDTADFTGSR